MGGREKPWEASTAQVAAMRPQGTLGSPEVPVTSSWEALAPPCPERYWLSKRQEDRHGGEPDQKQVVPTSSVTVEKQRLLCISALHPCKSDLHRDSGSIP